MNVEGTGRGVTLAEVVFDLSGLVSVLAGDGDELQRVASRVVFYDPESPQPIQRGDIVLAVGVPFSELAQVATMSAAAKAAALVVRARPGGATVKTSDGTTAAGESERSVAVDAPPVRAQAAVWAETSQLEHLVAVCRTERLPLAAAQAAVSWERLYSLIQASLGSRAWQTTAAADSGIRLGDMFELASTLSDLVGGPTILEDAYFRVIAYSAYSGESDWGRQQAILARQIPAAWLAHLRDAGVLQRLRTSDDVIRLDTGPVDARPRLITSVRVADELLGIIWVAEGERKLDSGAEERLREGRQLALPHYQRYLSADRLGNLRRGELFRIMLEEGGGAVSAAAHELRLSPSSNFCLIALRATTASDGVGRRELLPALLEAFRSDSIVTTVGDLVWGLAVVRGSGDQTRLKQIAQRCVTQLPHASTQDQSTAVISSPRPLASGTDAAQAEVRTLLRLSARRSQPVLVLAGWEVEAELLAERAESVLSADARFVYSKLEVLEKYDEQHHSDLAPTLAAYLLCGQQVGRTASQLSLHQTSTRYRLRRVSEVGGIDLNNKDEWLACVLHLLAARRLDRP